MNSFRDSLALTLIFQAQLMGLWAEVWQGISDLLDVVDLLLHELQLPLHVAHVLNLQEYKKTSVSLPDILGT